MAASFKIQGYNYTGYGTDVYGTATSRQQLLEIRQTGANAVAIIPEFYQQTLHSNALFRNEITPTDADVIAGIKAAHARGLSVLLNPHIDTLDDQWRAYLAPADPVKWFQSYKAMEVHYATIAQQTGVESFSVGCELESMTVGKYRAQWLDIIDAVRDVYHGKLTYASTTSEAATLSFWDKLDTIGVDGYFPLAVADKNPTVAELQYAWMHPSNDPDINASLGGKSPVDYVHDLAVKYGKHIVFTEAGFRAIDGDAIDPGDWSKDGAVDAKEQADLYKALFNTFASQGGDWFDGFYFWDWRADNFTEPKDYHTKGRAAQDVINLWYGLDDHRGAVPNTGMVLYGSVKNDRLSGSIGGTKILGNDGNDRLVGGAGSDVLIGGSATAPGSRSVLEIGAYADMLGGVGAKFKVFVNGQLVGQGEAKGAHGESWEISQFAFNFATPAAFQNVRVVFTNDDAVGQQDRNLYVNSLSINGEIVSLSKASNAQVAHSGTLYADGAFSIAIGTQSKDMAPLHTDSDTLDGGLGKDILTGGSGKDFFDFTRALAANVDTITDFAPVDDTIRLSASVFAALSPGKLPVGAFNTGAAATQADDRIVYNTKTHALLYDADGLNGHAGVQFAIVQNGAHLSAADFLVI